MPTTATDLRYGRRGGGWIPAGAGAPPTVICDVCGRPAYFAVRHRDCAAAGAVVDALEPDGDGLQLGLALG